jgi:hypothetical protein
VRGKFGRGLDQIIPNESVRAGDPDGLYVLHRPGRPNSPPEAIGT